MIRLEAAFYSGWSQRGESLDRFGNALEIAKSKILQLEQIAQQSPRGIRDHHHVWQAPAICRARWLLGYPDTALAVARRALSYAREFGQVPTLTHALVVTSLTFVLRGGSTKAMTNLEEAAALADEKGAMFWKAIGMANQGCALVVNGQMLSAVTMITSGLAAFRSTGSTLFTPWYLSNYAKASFGDRPI